MDELRELMNFYLEMLHNFIFQQQRIFFKAHLNLPNLNLEFSWFLKINGEKDSTDNLFVL